MTTLRGLLLGLSRTYWPNLKRKFRTLMLHVCLFSLAPLSLYVSMPHFLCYVVRWCCWFSLNLWQHDCPPKSHRSSKWQSCGELEITFPYINAMLEKAQDPSECDKITKVQKMLDDTKIVLVWISARLLCPSSHATHPPFDFTYALYFLVRIIRQGTGSRAKDQWNCGEIWRLECDVKEVLWWFKGHEQLLYYSIKIIF